MKLGADLQDDHSEKWRYQGVTLSRLSEMRHGVKSLNFKYEISYRFDTDSWWQEPHLVKINRVEIEEIAVERFWELCTILHLSEDSSEAEKRLDKIVRLNAL